MSAVLLCNGCGAQVTQAQELYWRQVHVSSAMSLKDCTTLLGFRLDFCVGCFDIVIKKLAVKP